MTRLDTEWIMFSLIEYVEIMALSTTAVESSLLGDTTSAVAVTITILKMMNLDADM